MTKKKGGDKIPMKRCQEERRVMKRGNEGKEGKQEGGREKEKNKKRVKGGEKDEEELGRQKR